MSYPHRLFAIGASFFTLITVVSCNRPNDPPDADSAVSTSTSVKTAANEPAEPPLDEHAFDEALLAIAKEYSDWGRVDQDLNWAPELCMLPSPGKGRISDSDDEGTHGKKLYYLYAKQRDEYRAKGAAADGVGQAIVKEAWKPIAEPENKAYFEVFNASQRPYAQQDGKVYRTGEKAGLFVMMRLDPQTPGTDDGWVYATLDADGEKVTSAGQLESCMGCHVREDKTRLFGLPDQPPEQTSVSTPLTPTLATRATLEPRLREIAKEYTSWKRVDEAVRWAPTLCRRPPSGIGRLSASEDPETHGQKLYYLYAKVRDESKPLGHYPDEVGQVLVKEAWKPRPVGGPESQQPGTPTIDRPSAVKDGNHFEPGDPAGLFVMMRLDPQTPDTDDGWIYATLERDGTVTSAGQLESCMGCHVREGKSRLFGLPD